MGIADAAARLASHRVHPDIEEDARAGPPESGPDPLGNEQHASSASGASLVNRPAESSSSSSAQPDSAPRTVPDTTSRALAIMRAEFESERATVQVDRAVLQKRLDSQAEHTRQIMEMLAALRPLHIATPPQVTDPQPAAQSAHRGAVLAPCSLSCCRLWGVEASLVEAR